MDANWIYQDMEKRRNRFQRRVRKDAEIAEKAVKS